MSADAARVPRIAARNLRENVYATLRDAFISGAFAPGETVSLRDLAADLGTSLTPVREAVRRLVAEGALVDTPSRTLRVPPFDAGRMRDLKAARLALEGLALERAAARMEPGELDAIEALIEGSRGGPVPDLASNYAFHLGLYRPSGSEVLLPLIEGLWVQYGAYLNRIVREEAARAMEEHVHHAEIVAALRAGDLPAAQAALRADIERSFAVLLTEDDA